MTNLSPITVEADIAAPIEKVWECWNNPKHVQEWNHASDDWHSPTGTNDLREGGTFAYRMEARDQSVGFDFGGTYTKVVEHKEIGYTMSDGRKVSITFDSNGDRTHVRETFDAESENPPEMQKQGWQAILDNFKKYTEGQAQLM